MALCDVTPDNFSNRKDEAGWVGTGTKSYQGFGGLES